MSEVTDIVVPMLQKIQAQLARLDAEMTNVKEDLQHIKVRMTSLEANGNSLVRQVDNYGMPLERIERRLDLVEV